MTTDLRSLLCLSRGAVELDRRNVGMTYAPVAGEPGLVVALKGDLNRPYGEECYHVRPDGLWIASEHGEPDARVGAAASMRYFWSLAGEPGGELWLPEWALRGEEGGFTVACVVAPSPGRFDSRVRVRRVPPIIPGADWATTRVEEMGDPDRPDLLGVETYWFEHLPDGVAPSGWQHVRGGVTQGQPWRAGATAAFSPAIARVLDLEGMDRWVSTNAALPVPSDKPAPFPAPRPASAAQQDNAGCLALAWARLTGKGNRT